MPGAPFEIRSNGTPLAASPFSIASRSATWSVATTSSVPAARPAHIAARSSAGRSGGEMHAFATSTGSLAA